MFQHQGAQGAQWNHKFSGFGRGCGGFRGHKFGRQMMPWMRQFAGAFGSRIPANIEEQEDAFYLHLYAPGLVKENITVSVKEDVLSVAYKAAGSNDEGKYAHQEFAAHDFERLFQLNGKVLTDAISAAYADGVLKVTLPKNPETNQPAQKVTVS